MADFGKLNFSVSFNRTSAFPLEANSYFNNYTEAEQAAQTAVEPGSADSAYYIGQTLTVVTEGNAKNYIIQPDKTLLEVGSGSGSAEIAITDGEEPQGDEVLWVDMNENTSSSWEELGIQPKLESGVNIKTINGDSILGEGNIELSSGGLDDAPSDGVTYGRKDGSWVKANYGTPDEVLNIDELFSLMGSEQSITVPTPEGVFEKVEDACNKGISYLDLSLMGTNVVVPMVIAKAEVKSEQVGYTINAAYKAYHSEQFYLKLEILVQVEEDESVVTVTQLIIPQMGTIARLDELTQTAALNGYSKPSSYSAISSSDTINAAIGKLEAGLVEVINIPVDQEIDINQYENYTIEISGYYSDPATTMNCMFTDNFFIYTDSNDTNIFQLRKIIGYIPNVDADGNNATITLNYQWSDKRFNITVRNDNGHDIVSEKEITSIRAIKYK